MKNLINLQILGQMLLLMILTSSSGCSALPLVPALQDRTLRISPDISGFEYQYDDCVKKFLGICTKIETVKELYDLSDEAVRHKLIDMGFIVTRMH